ncbi:MAG: hypothetical protein UY09_C0047G0005 [Parcubacteria group bacterium GW2011_GWA2_47_8]|nr:MAG: hypothetical protein UY09_C0047G0005 [Parcubacteria group bacterium GW2011_GWA2_47_8]
MLKVLSVPITIILPNMSNDLHIQPPKIIVTTAAIFLVVFAAFGVVKLFNEIKRGEFIGQEFDRVNTIVVSGEGRAEAKPDIALLVIDVLSKGVRIDSVQDENTRKMNAVISYIKEQGIADGDILDQVVAKGANGVPDLRFDIDEKEELQAQARGEAIEQAQDKAKELAKQLGVDLVRISSFSENSGPYYPEPMYARAEMMKSASFDSAPIIEPGQTEITSNVTIVYEIK